MTRDYYNTQRSARAGNQQQQHHHHHNQSHHNNSSGDQRHQNHKIVHLDPFELFSSNDESLKRAIELIERVSLNKFKLTVLTIVSKTALDDIEKNQLVQALLNKKEINKRRNNRDKNAARQSNQKVPADTNEAVSSGFKAGPTEVDNDGDGNGYDHDDSDNQGHDNDGKNGKFAEAQSESIFENQVHGHVDGKSDIVVMNLSSFLDATKLCQLSEKLSSNLIDIAAEKSGPINQLNQLITSNIWPAWNQNFIKTLLTISLVSHIIVFYHPEANLDFNLIQMLKVLDTLRLKSQTRITDLLETLASKQMFSQQWIRQGRIACPRALFVFDASELIKRNKQMNSKSELSNMKRQLEDQIYKIFKRTSITQRNHNINSATQQHQNHSGNNSLLHLPDQGEFVFLITRHDNSEKSKQCDQEAPRLNDNSDFATRFNCDQFYLNLFKTLEINENDAKPNGDHIVMGGDNRFSDFIEPKDEEIRNTINKKSKQLDRNNSLRIVSSGNNRLLKFLMRHVADIQNLANNQISDTHHENKRASSSNNNAMATSGCIILPRYDDFFNVLLRLKCLMFPMKTNDGMEEKSSSSLSSQAKMIDFKSPDERRFVDIYDLNNYDELFSKRHCHKTRLAAFDYYIRNLQAQQTLNQVNHSNSLEAAKLLYSNHARGSAYSINLDLLVEQCQRYWENQSASIIEETRKSLNSSSGGGRGLKTTISSNINEYSSQSSTRSGPSNQQNQMKSSRTNFILSKRSNNLKMTTVCSCNRQSNFLITSSDKSRKLERLDVRCID